MAGQGLERTEGDVIAGLRIVVVKDFVIYPAQLAPLLIADPASVKAVDDALKENGVLGFFSLRESPKEKGEGRRESAEAAGLERPEPSDEGDEVRPEDLFHAGTVCKVLKMMRLPNDTMRLLIQGLHRCRLRSVTKPEDKPYYVAEVTVLRDILTGSDEEVALVRNISGLFREVVANIPNFGEELQVLVANITDPEKLTDLIASNLNIPLSEKQRLLDTPSVEDRARILSVHLTRELEIIKIGSQIQSKVKSSMDKKQREWFLRQELEAIRKELGESDEPGEEVEELRKKIAEAGMPEEVRKTAEKELNRMAKMQPGFAEYSVSRTYIEWLIELPWSKETEDNLDIAAARKVLDRDHYDLKDVKEVILDFLAVKRLKKDARSNILCLVGPPGVGKTSLGRSIAETLGRKFVRMSLGGIHDEAEIRGHRRTYVGALPGRIIQGLRNAGSRNPVFMLDEIDKIGQDFRGDPAAALLEVLDPEQNATFRDNYLEVPFDLSKVLFITTANMPDTIPPPLLDRMEVVKISGYTAEEKVRIAKHYLVPRQLEENGLTKEQLVLKDQVLKRLIMDYTREAGVRSLEREIRALCRKVARKIGEGTSYDPVVSPEALTDYLGKPRYFHDSKEHVDQPGIATGLAWTPAGGSILFIEATRMKGKERLVLTGQMGEVMKESATIALDLIRSRAKRYGIDPKVFQSEDIHIHIPEGAVPKDGPSAGITLATALYSLLTGRKVRHDIAMTGELTLRGKVLPVGGIKEKILAARQAGICRVILPHRNRKDVEEIDPAVRRGMRFEYVETVDEVFALAVRPDHGSASSRKEGRTRGAKGRNRGRRQASA